MSLQPKASTSGITGNSYFNDYTTTSAYVQLFFGFPASHITVTNDSTGTDEVQVSWNGTTTHYNLLADEFKDLSAGGRTSVYIKATSGGEKARISAE